MKRTGNFAFIAGACVLGILILWGFLSDRVGDSERGMPELREEAVVTRIIDGDTFEIASGEHVRLICVDAPEKGSAKGEEARLFLAQLIENKTVVLERDISERDAYGRLLRYVFADEVFVNRQIVREGQAEVFRYGDDTRRCDEIAS